MRSSIVDHKRPPRTALQSRCMTVDPEDGRQCPEAPVVRAVYETTENHRFELDLCEWHWKHEQSKTIDPVMCQGCDEVDITVEDEVTTVQANAHMDGLCEACYLSRAGGDHAG